MAGIVLTLVGTAAIAVGLGLIVAPDGDGFKLSVELLKNTPFRDYFIPGIVLLTVIGVGSLLAAIPAFKLHRFAGAATLLLGLALVLFIVAPSLLDWNRKRFIADFNDCWDCGDRLRSFDHGSGF